MMARIAALAHDGRAGTAAEFALVLPMAILFLVGMLDVGRLMWTWNQAEKATQMGARYAVSTNMVPTALQGYSFAVSGGIAQGDPIPQSAFGGVKCTYGSGKATCTCNTGTCGPGTLVSNQTAANTAFNNIVDRMRLMLPQITANNVQIDYDFSGLGYAGDPNGPDVAPLVRVSLRQDNPLTFQPLTLILFKTAITLPGFSAALTQEDGQGTVAY